MTTQGCHISLCSQSHHQPPDLRRLPLPFATRRRDAAFNERRSDAPQCRHAAVLQFLDGRSEIKRPRDRAGCTHLQANLTRLRIVHVLCAPLIRRRIGAEGSAIRSYLRTGMSSGRYAPLVMALWWAAGHREQASSVDCNCN
jgi:hypothetical protein